MPLLEGVIIPASTPNFIEANMIGFRIGIPDPTLDPDSDPGSGNSADSKLNFRPGDSPCKDPNPGGWESPPGQPPGIPGVL